MNQKESIKQKLNSAKSKVTDENIGYATLNIEYLIKLIKEKKQEQPHLSIPIIMYDIEKSYKRVAFNSSGNSRITTRSDFCLLRTLMYVQNHPDVIFQTIDTVDRSLFFSKKEYFKYTPNINDSVKELMQAVCSSILSRYNTDAKVRFIKGQLSEKERIAMQKEILEKIANYQKTLEKEIKLAYTSNIIEMAQVLDENGCFGKNIERHNRRLRMLGLDEFQEKDNSKKSTNAIITSMSDWKNPDIVGKLPLETLIVASAFFTNRFCKEYIAFKKSAFLMEELNLLEEDVLKNSFSVPKELDFALLKYEFLQAEARKKYVELLNKNIAPSVTGEIHYVPYSLDYGKQEFAEYKSFFDGVLPARSNDFFIDCQRFMEFDNAMEILYQKKDMVLDSLIIFLLENKTKINWGYIEERNEQGNSIEQKKAMVSLGFDVDKFNTSIRLHKSLKELKKLISASNGSDILPVYNGEEDWVVKDKFGSLTEMNTQVFRMFNNQERKQLKERLSKLSPQNRLYGFVSHLNWLANRGIPQKHKKRKIVHLNTGKVEELDCKIKTL